MSCQVEGVSSVQIYKSENERRISTFYMTELKATGVGGEGSID